MIYIILSIAFTQAKQKNKKKVEDTTNFHYQK